ncbi:CotH kinase family protein [Polaribacter sp.]|uniref:CotH kinase family protein n=1 Tax=Polaribacter sp. TaxID=1920175 RepID=UPI003F6BFED7
MKIIYRPDESRNYASDINNSNYLNYNGKIGIELRGSSSQDLDKKPYGFETLESDDVTNNNVSLLGLPSENDWVLNSLAFDPSMIRDYLSYTLAQNMGNYAPRVKYVEVIVNNDYKGVYILTEKIKIDSDRVDIKKLSENDNGPRSITGGYLVKADKTTGGDAVAWTLPNTNGWFTEFLHDNPNSEDITNLQAAYIRDVFNDLANKTNPINSSIIDGYPAIIDVPSFIDFMIMAELTSNADAYQFSTYFHKDKGGKLRAGPIWDYNLTFDNDLFLWGFDRSHYNVWQFDYENTGTKFWKDLFRDKTFKCYFAKRWSELTTTNSALNYNVIEAKIDELRDLLRESQIREQQRWGTVANHAENIAAIKIWIQNRIDWMDTNLGTFTNCQNVSTPNLVISKIHYHPLEDGDYSSKKLEFIEITNNSNTNVNLSGYYISELGISYQFPPNSSIAANKQIYLCNDSEVFEEYYGITPFGEYHRSLSNNSYHLVLADAFGNRIDEVMYNDENPWPAAADGLGAFLQLKDLNSDNNIARNWLANPYTLANTDIFLENKIVVYPNPTNGNIYFRLNSKSKNITLHFRVFNAIGQKLGEFKIDNHNPKLGLHHLKKGMYYYTISNGTGIIKKDKIIKN